MGCCDILVTGATHECPFPHLDCKVEQAEERGTTLTHVVQVHENRCDALAAIRAE